MKAKDLLDWLCQSSMDCKNVNTIIVPNEGEGESEQNEDWWFDMFGGVPPCAANAGKYLYYYDSVHPYAVLINGECYAPDVTVEIPTDDGFDYAYLYEIED